MGFNQSHQQPSWEEISQILTMAGLGSWALLRDEDGGIVLRPNGSFFEITGISPEDMPENFFEFAERYFSPEDRGVLLNKVDIVFRGQADFFDFEHALLTPGPRMGEGRATPGGRAESLWLRSFGRPGPPDAEGGVTAIFGFLQDMTSRRQHVLAIENALKEKERMSRDLEHERSRLDAVIAAADVGTWVWECPKGGVTTGHPAGRMFHSRRNLEILGWPEEKAQSDMAEFAGAVVPEDHPRAEQTMKDYLEGKTSMYLADFRMVKDNGELVWVQSRGQVVERNKQGRPVLMMGICFDTTEEKKTHEELASSKELINTVINAAQIGIWAWNFKERRIHFNAVMADFLGFDPARSSESIDCWNSFIHPDDIDKVKNTVDPLVLPGAPDRCTLTVRLRRQDGAYTWFFEVGQVLERDEDGRATRLVFICFDFTQRKMLEQKQQEALATIAQQNREMEALAAVQSELLERIRHQVAEIVEISGHWPGRFGLDLNPSLPPHLSGAEETGFFADYLGRAFTYISRQMAWYKAILDSLPFPVGVFDLDGKWAYLNQPSAQVHGDWPVKNYIGKENNAKRDGYTDSDIETDADGISTRFTRFMPGPNGRVYYGQNSLLRDGNLNEIGRIEVLRDITAVREANERTSIMLDAMPMACNFWDENFNNIDCNKAAALLFDLPDKQSYLKNFEKLSPKTQPNGRLSSEMAAEYIGRAFKEGRLSFEWMHKKLDGTPVPSEITLVRVARRNHFIVAGYTRDLRELKQTMAERDMERRLLRKIMDSAPICFVITVGDEIKFITPFATNFTGCRAGDKAAGAFIDSDEYESLRLEIMENNFINWRPIIIKKADGQLRSMLLNAFKTNYYGENGVMAWLIDVTDLNEQARELKAARDLAEESTRAKSEFLANMSHEIRTPMNAILGLIHLVQQTDLSPQQREYLYKTESSAKTLLRIINDILDFSKIEAGKLEMESEEFFLDDVLQQVTDQVTTKASEKGVEFLVKVPGDTPAGLVGDQIRLAQILSNLTSNAMKFTEKGQVALKVETVSESPSEVTLKFLMEDSGIGMTEDQCANLFTAFSQAERSTTRRYGGTGLGLTISKKLVEMMGGQIWCESRPGVGSTFGFTATFGRHDSENRYLATNRDFSGLAALAVDDNVVALDIVSDFLRVLGFSVATASNGTRALEIIEEKHNLGQCFDLILLDWKMPGLDGVEVAKTIKERHTDGPPPVIIMTTAYNRDNVLKEAQANGVTNVMTKPLSPTTMLNMLVDIFGRGKAQTNPRLKKARDLAQAVDFAGGRILLAEDNEVNQLVASRILKNAGLMVDIAENGLKAVQMVQENTYDLVLMDIQMPEMDGITATKEIRALPGFKDLPIVAMTANAMSGDKELSLSAGMNDHINKPINLQELFSSLGRWLKKNEV